MEDEIDGIAKLRTAREAAIILGYKEENPTTIQRLVREGVLKATKIGNEYRFDDKDLMEYLFWKNTHKHKMGTRPHIPKINEYPVNCNLESPLQDQIAI